MSEIGKANWGAVGYSKRTRRKPRGGKRGDAHVRLYGWELETPAYRTLSTDARALLVEMRALYSGKQNRVFLSVRQMQVRLDIGQRRAQRARDELLERGWIRLIEPGAFSRKTKQASVYALTNEPLGEQDGATAPKDYMRWQAGKITVAAMATDGSQPECNSTVPQGACVQDSSCDDYLKADGGTSMVATSATQIGYQRQRADLSMLYAVVQVALSEHDQFQIIFAWCLLAAAEGVR